MRRWIDLFKPLVEGIDTSAIDDDARAALQDHLMSWLRKDLEHYASIYPNEDVHEIYDAYYDSKRERTASGGFATFNPVSKSFVQVLCRKAAEALTDVTHKHLRERFGNQVEVPASKWAIPTMGGPGAGKSSVFSQQKKTRLVDASVIKVILEPREFSDNENKQYGGYFQGAVQNPYIAVFVDSSEVFHAAMDCIQIIITGDGGEYYHRLVDIIAPVFVHEYTHLEQHIRGGLDSPESDWGYITAGGGRRGGRRSPRDGTLGWLRYKSSAFEIEAFASQTASELLAEIRRHARRYDPKAPIPSSEINYLLQSLAAGYVSSSSLRGYSAIGWGEFSDEAKRLGIKPHEMNMTWKRYLKAVYRHIVNYRQQKIGNFDGYYDGNVRNAPDNWKQYASLGFRECARELAQDVVHQLLEKYPHPWHDADHIKFDDLLWKSATFLSAAFFNSEDYNDARDDAVQASFKNLVLRLYSQSKDRLQQAA